MAADHDPGDDLIVAGAKPLPASLVRRYFGSNPDIAASVRAERARVVIFEPAPDERWDPRTFFVAMQRALDAAEAALAPDERPIYLAWTTVVEIAETDAFDIRDAPRSPYVRLVTRRGPFLGYLAVGEGGLAYFDAEGHHGGRPTREEVLVALRWPSWRQ